MNPLALWWVGEGISTEPREYESDWLLKYHCGGTYHCGEGGGCREGSGGRRGRHEVIEPANTP